MARHLIDGEVDVQAKIGEVIARLEPAILTILINKLRIAFDGEANAQTPLFCYKYGVDAQRDPSKCKHDCFTCAYDMLRSDDTDLQTFDIIKDTIEEITDMELAYRHLDSIELGVKLDLIQEDPTTGKITRIPSDDTKYDQIISRLEMIEKDLQILRGDHNEQDT